MAKICNRDYSAGNMLTTKLVDGVPSCPNCYMPTACHGASIETRALYWALSDYTGISSLAIAKHMTGNPMGRLGMMPPSDADDRGRCIRLLQIIPEWIPRLKEMVKYDNDSIPAGFVINSSGISAYDNSWAKQIPLIIREGGLDL